MPGKKGNKNALKHGIFCDFIAVVDDEQMKDMSDDDLKDEIALIRVRLKHALQKVKDATDDKERVNWDFACRHWMQLLIDAKTKKAELRQTEQTVWTSLLEAMRAANDKQHVR